MRAAVAATALLLLGLTACASTTYDGRDTLPLTTAVPTTLPTGSAAELLPLLLDEARGVSRLITSGGDDRAAAERIDALWGAIAQEIGRDHTELLGGFEGALAMIHGAVDEHRPADADKAYKNLRALADAIAP